MARGAYYNEIDPFAIGVLKRRIADGSLPPGELDDRDIRSVQAADLRGYAQVHLFAGIGGFGLAARLAGWPDERPLWTGGYPCQPFSLAGLRRGTSDDRYLWPDCSRLLGAVESRPAWCLFENVDGHRDLGLDRTLFDLEALGYAGRPFWVPACGVGAPHDRMRVWIVARDVADGASGGCDQGAGLRQVRQVEDGSGASRADGLDGELADASGVLGRTVVGHEPDRDVSGGTSAVADAGDGQFPEPRRRPEGRDGLGPIGAALELVNAEGERRREGRPQPKLRRGRATPPGTSGASRDPWADAIWIDCADGRLRRTQPGLGLLAHGVSDRVARLRTLGNAIVPHVAARVLAAILQTEDAR